MDFLFIASMESKKVKASPFRILLVFQYFPFLQEGSKDKHHPISPQKNKGFINYVFCRNWAVRNPAGTRLDSSSLVNKQVGHILHLDQTIARQKTYPSQPIFIFRYNLQHIPS